MKFEISPFITLKGDISSFAEFDYLGASPQFSDGFYGFPEVFQGYSANKKILKHFFSQKNEIVAKIRLRPNTDQSYILATISFFLRKKCHFLREKNVSKKLS